jgi:predicted  nucleic acid-binding Zn-ribbon protein
MSAQKTAYESALQAKIDENNNISRQLQESSERIEELTNNISIYVHKVKHVEKELDYERNTLPKIVRDEIVSYFQEKDEELTKTEYFPLLKNYNKSYKEIIDAFVTERKRLLGNVLAANNRISALEREKMETVKEYEEKISDIMLKNKVKIEEIEHRNAEITTMLKAKISHMDKLMEDLRAQNNVLQQTIERKDVHIEELM